MKNENRISGVLAAMTLAGLCLPVSAQATVLTAQEALNQFNLIVLGDSQSYSHVDGRTFVTGNLTGGDYVQHPADTPASAYAGLTVLGNASNLNVNGLGVTVLGNLSNANINSGAGIVAGNASSVNFNGGVSAVGGSVSGVNFNAGQYTGAALVDAVTNASLIATSNDFASLFATTSLGLSQLADTGGLVNFSGGKVTFNALAVDGVAVFDLTNIDTSVFAANEFEFNLNGATTVIFNSDEKDIDIHANFLGGSAVSLGDILLWNFYDAEDVTLSSQFGGAILAASATLTNFNNIEGSVVAGDLFQYGEIHAQSYAGEVDFPPPPTVPNTAAVPEPGTSGLILGGLGLLGLYRRSRQKSRC